MKNLLVLLAICALISFQAGCRSNQARIPQPEPNQTVFASSDDAVKAVLDATKKNDTSSLLGIFGETGKDIILSGNPAEDGEIRKIFTGKADEKISITSIGEKKYISIGNDEWKFPVPIVSNKAGWFFDTVEGKDELLTLLIGRNELNAMKTCLAYVKAQQEYAAEDHDGDCIRSYAIKICSDPGKKNGLYWESQDGKSLSPIGPLLAAATPEEVADKNAVAPFHGYLFKILLSQGKASPGGKKDFLKDGKMIDGFGFLAYPSAYGETGIMTFIVNDIGVVYEKNLGPKTSDLVKKITEYNPDDTWNPAEDK